jgi:hypothetical protein
MRQAKYWLFLLPLFFILVCVGAFAQANSEITGIVTDQTGAVVAGADITLLDPATGFTRTATSGQTGLYDFSGLNPGNYVVTVTAKNFEKFVQTGIVVNTSATFRVDAKLTLGAETQTVNVVADALAVQTDSNVVSTLISATEITSIATENRNFAALAALGLGASSAVPDNNTLGAFGSNYTLSINGLRQTHNIWLIDGGESSDRGGGGGMQIMPSQDAIAEFNTLTSNYPPDYGISSGATISLSLKSGAKAFHGTAWEENRATAYNANSYLNKYAGATNPRAATHYNIYGFNVSGPVYIPHVYNSNKNKTFFFYNEEWRRTSAVSSSDSATINKADFPTTANTANGLTYVDPTWTAGKMDAGHTLLQVPSVGPTSYYQMNKLGAYTGGGCFQGIKTLDVTATTAARTNNPNAAEVDYCPSGQVIPTSLFDASAVTYLNSGVIPAANVGSTDYTNASIPLPTKVRDDVVRIDHNFNDKWAILGHYIGDSQTQGYGQPELGWTDGSNYRTLTSDLISPAHSAAIKLSGTINPNLLVEASFNYDGNAAKIAAGDGSLAGSVSSFLPTSWATSWTPVVPAYAVTRNVWPAMEFDSTFGGGINMDTGTEPYHNGAQDYTPKVDVSYTVGKHSAKFGFSYNRYTKNQMIYGDSQGKDHFGSLTGNSVTDALLGLTSSYFQAQIAPVRHYVNQTPSVYAMDSWHVTPRLTLQLGVRYDALPQTWERQNLLGNFNPADYLGGASNAPVWNTDGTISATSPHLYNYIPQGLTSGIQSYINGTNLAGQNHTPNALVKNDFDTLQPRVGFSDDIFGNGKTVLRGGFGTFYERMQGNSAFNVATSAPFYPTLTLQNAQYSTPGLNYNTGTSVTPSELIFASSQGAMATTFRAPAVAMYSLGVQREVKPSIIWVVQYVGNVAWHQNVINGSINSLSPNIGLVNYGAGTADARMVQGDSGGKYTGDIKTGGFANVGGMNAYRQYQGYTQISQDQNNTNGGYNGFQTGLRVQNRWGLSGDIDYTWSHEIDITYQDRVSLDNPWNTKYDKGSGYLDRRHILNVDYVYNLPFFNKSQGLLKSIAGGWQLAGTFVKETGVPVSLGLSTPGGYDPVGLGEGYTNRPNITAGGKLAYSKKVDNWYDKTRVDNNITPSWAGGANLGFGNWGKDTLVGPGRVNFTTNLYKDFQIYKTATFQIRAESFNTFNHTEFSSIDSTANKVNGTYDPRNLELGGRFVF